MKVMFNNDKTIKSHNNQIYYFNIYRLILIFMNNYKQYDPIYEFLITKIK